MELGSGPRGGTSQIYQCSLLSDLPLLEGGGEQPLAGGHSQHTPYPVSALEDYASKHPTSAREGDLRG